MKLGKKGSLIVIVILIVAALAALFTIHSRQAGERRGLEDRLTRAETLLPTLIANRNAAQNQLTEAQSSLDISEGKYPDAVESIEYGEDFFKVAYGQNLYSMAGGCGVELTRLSATKPTDKKLEGITYSVSSFVVVVEGSTDNILKFIDAIGTGINYDPTWGFQLPWSVEVKSVNMEVNRSKATISMDIYAYTGV
jgi:hypothetical protein